MYCVHRNRSSLGAVYRSSLVKIFAGEIEPSTCCVATVKLRGERVAELSTAAVLLISPPSRRVDGASRIGVGDIVANTMQTEAPRCQRTANITMPTCDVM